MVTDDEQDDDPHPGYLYAYPAENLDDPMIIYGVVYTNCRGRRILYLCGSEDDALNTSHGMRLSEGNPQVVYAVTEFKPYPMD